MPSETKTVAVPAGLIAALIVVAVGVPMQFWRGYVISIVWRWFAPVIDPRMPPLSTMQAVALCAIITALCFFRTRKEDRDRTSLELAGEALIHGLVMPLVVLGLSFITHLFVHV